MHFNKKNMLFLFSICSRDLIILEKRRSNLPVHFGTCLPTCLPDCINNSLTCTVADVPVLNMADLPQFELGLILAWGEINLWTILIVREENFAAQFLIFFSSCFFPWRAFMKVHFTQFQPIVILILYDSEYYGWRNKPTSRTCTPNKKRFYRILMIST